MHVLNANQINAVERLVEFLNTEFDGFELSAEVRLSSTEAREPSRGTVRVIDNLDGDLIYGWELPTGLEGA